MTRQVAVISDGALNLWRGMGMGERQHNAPRWAALVIDDLIEKGWARTGKRFEDSKIKIRSLVNAMVRDIGFDPKRAPEWAREFARLLVSCGWTR